MPIHFMTPANYLLVMRSEGCFKLFNTQCGKARVGVFVANVDHDEPLTRMRLLPLGRCTSYLLNSVMFCVPPTSLVSRSAYFGPSRTPFCPLFLLVANDPYSICEVPVMGDQFSGGLGV